PSAPAIRGNTRFTGQRAAAPTRAASQEQKTKGAEPTAAAETLSSGEPAAATAPSNGQQTAAHDAGALPAAPGPVQTPRPVPARRRPSPRTTPATESPDAAGAGRFLRGRRSRAARGLARFACPSLTSPERVGGG